jgi:hypothetical protein
VLPVHIRHLVSLYPWESYTVKHELASTVAVRMTDSTDQAVEQIPALAAWVNICRKDGPVLVHCQAGLNRSSLVVAMALILEGSTADAAIALIRQKRSPACLCNPAFENWLRAQRGPRETYASQCTRVYTRRGKVAHLKAPFGTIANGRTLCPVMPSWPDEWLGTGSQAEYDLAASLPLCKACGERARGEDLYYSEPSQWMAPDGSPSPAVQEAAS